MFYPKEGEMKHEGNIKHYTGRFIMFSVITNIYKNKTKGPITATGKLIFFFLTTRDIRYAHYG